MNRKTFIKEFQTKLSLDFPYGFQSKWHKYIFHFSDITNILSILNNDTLYSRNKAIQLGLMSNDNADDDVIANTNLNAKDFVRFYFGAKTPTQYHNEGFKTKSSIHNNAHCPFPIFLLFNFVKLLTREDILFSNGNIASSQTEIYDDITSLNNLEFKYIYHRDFISETMDKSHIIQCRHAEVLIPTELNVYEYLSKIYVRSEAEKTTLLYGLSSEKRNLLKDKVRVGTIGLFYADRLYVEEVYLDNDSIKLIFSKSTIDKYEFTFIVKNLDTGEKWKHDTGEISLENRKVSIKIKPSFINASLKFKLYINENLAYKNKFISSNGEIL